MPIVEQRVTVDGSLDDVFDLSQSCELRAGWDPSVTSQRLLGGAEHAAAGVRTETVSRHRLRMVTEYLTFRRPAVVEITMIDGPPFVRTFSGSWRFSAPDDGHVEVTLRYDFTSEPRILAPVIERIGTWCLRRAARNRLEAFRAARDNADLRARLRELGTETGIGPDVDDGPIGPIVDGAWLRAGLAADRDVVICHVGSSMAGSDPEADFARRHLPGARYVSLDDVLADAPSGTAGRHPLPSAADFARDLGSLGIADGTAVVAYDDRGGAFAARLVWMLRIIGQPAALLDGGLDGWPDEAVTDVHADTTDHGGHSPDQSTSAPEPVIAVERAVRDWPLDALADALDVERHLAHGGVVIDSRDPARFAGLVEPIDAVAGHVPGAANLSYADNLDSAGHFRSVDELRSRFTPVVGSDNDPIVYCGSGVTACHNALAIEHAGLRLPRVYVGSWSGWSADPDRPVATGTAP